jgi:hypothetical protein
MTCTPAVEVVRTNSLQGSQLSRYVSALPPPSGLQHEIGVKFHQLHRKQAIEIPILCEQEELHSGIEGAAPHLKRLLAGCLATGRTLKIRWLRLIVTVKYDVIAYMDI